MYGRSKEKRSDAKLVVLALVINSEGFIKYSNIFEGNTADSKTLATIIDKLRLQTSTTAQRAIVVLDAGIATNDNLALLQTKGYDYVCVSRSTLKNYQAVEAASPQFITTKNKVYGIRLLPNLANKTEKFKYKLCSKFIHSFIKLIVIFA